MKRYILHVHTYHSGCSTNSPAKILKIAKSAGINGIAITDHNTIKGALETKKLNKDKDFEVVVGEEVSTDIGHVLVLYLKKKINPGKVEDVAKEARAQGAICILAHPYNILQDKVSKIFGVKSARKSLAKKDLDRLKLFDAVEGFNARCFLKKENLLSQKLARDYGKTIVAGSDAHFAGELLNTVVEFSDKYSLKEAIMKNKITLSRTNKSDIWSKFKSTIITSAPSLKRFF